MAAVEKLVTQHLDLWATAIKRRSAAGRGSSSKVELYGIKRLRELILELAVRGLLVPQDPRDESASELLRRIAAEKATLVKEGKIKKDKLLLLTPERGIPFDIPSSWEWAGLPQICDYGPGKTPSTKNPVYWEEGESGFPWVSISDMEHLRTLTKTAKRITGKAAAEVFRSEPVPAGTMIMSFKLTLGKISKLGVDAYHNEAIIALRPYSGICDDYVFNFLPGRASAGNSKAAIKGNTLNSESLAELLIPIPPAKEQQRIVAKVDELMALCDQLEQQTDASLGAHQTLVVTLLNTLTSAADHTPFASSWHRIAEHFDTLFTTEESIDELKKTILQLAVMGKLVPQNPNDEPAGELLKKIAAEKAKLVREKKIKKEDTISVVEDVEKPYELPMNWEWTRLIAVSANIHYGYTASSDEGIKSVRLLRITDIQDDTVNWASVPGCEIETDKIGQYQLVDDDILIARTGGTIGKSYLVQGISVCAVFASYLIRVRHLQGMSSRYKKLYLGSQLYWSQLYAKSMGTGQPNVNGESLKGLVVPVPPIAEQHRIVAKVDELMALCDQLKARLTDAQTTQLHLADALAEQALVEA